MHARARQRQHRDDATTQCAFCVLSGILLVLAILLGSALYPPHPSDFPSDLSVNEAENKANNLFPTSNVPYKAERVAAQALEAGSKSLTGRPCEQQGCLSQGDGVLLSLLVTTDNRLVVVNEKLRTILVYSETGVDTIHLQHKPFGLAQLPDQLLVVACPYDSVILIVDIDAENHIVRNISTEKQYTSVAPGPNKDTLLVASKTHFTIDVITLQGSIVRTLVDSARLQDIDLFVSLTKHEEDVTACAFSKDGARSTLIRFRLSESEEVDQVHTETLLFPSIAVSADRSGNMFINHIFGQVVLKKPDGEYRGLLLNPKPGEYAGSGIVVRDDRLAVAWSGINDDGFLLMEYKLFDE